MINLMILLTGLGCITGSQNKKNNMKPDLEIFEYTIGNPDFRGQTILSIDSREQISVRKILGEETTEFMGVMSDEEKQTFHKLLAENDPCDLKSTRKLGEPDEEQAVFKVKDANRECDTKLWINEQWENDNFRDWIKLVNTMVTRVSNSQN